MTAAGFAPMTKSATTVTETVTETVTGAASGMTLGSEAAEVPPRMRSMGAAWRQTLKMASTPLPRGAPNTGVYQARD
jgi:hypothetical protein